MKDEHANDRLQADPGYLAYRDSFHGAINPIPNRLLSMPMRGNMPLHEVLQAGVVLLGYYKLAPDRDSRRFEELTERFLKELDYPGFHGGAYASPKGLGGDAITFGAWDSVEVCPSALLT